MQSGENLPSIFNSIAPLEFRSLDAKPDAAAPLRRERGVVLPPWLPQSIEDRLIAASDEECERLCAAQHAAVRRSVGAEGEGAPAEEQYRRWAQREWQKLRLASSDAPAALCLEGEWAYGRRPDGTVSSYWIQRQPSGAYDYVEAKTGGGELRGTVVDAASVAPKLKPPGTFEARWLTDLGEGNGMVWLRLHDPGTLQSVFQGPGAPGGFRAVSRRMWATVAVTGDAEEELLTGPLARCEESGIIIPPWTPKEAADKMMQQPVERRKFFKTQQDMVLRQALGLSQDEPVTEELQRKWLRAALRESKRRPVSFDAPPVELPQGAALRYPVGARVLARTQKGWQQGTVVQHWWPIPGHPQKLAAPYQLRLHGVPGDMGLIFAPYDDDRFLTADPEWEKEQKAKAKARGAAQHADPAAKGGGGGDAELEQELAGLQEMLMKNLGAGDGAAAPDAAAAAAAPKPAPKQSAPELD